MPSSHLIFCRPLLLLPSIPPSIRVFSNESTLHMRWPKYWSFSPSIIPSKEHLGLISFRMDWLDLLAVQETLESLLQYHSSKASILWHSVFFMAQLSHPYTTTEKTIALTKGTCKGKIMSLLFNTLSQLSSVQLLSRVRLFTALWTAACHASLSITKSQSLLELMSFESVMPSNHLILCLPLSSHLQSFSASGSFPMS